MRGVKESQEGMFSYLSPEQRVPKNHPLRPIRDMVVLAFSEMWSKLETIYSSTGRPSIPPECSGRPDHPTNFSCFSGLAGKAL